LSRKVVESQTFARITSQIEIDFVEYKKKNKNTHKESEILDDFVIKKEHHENEMTDFEYADYFQYKYDKFNKVSLTDLRIYDILKKLDDDFIEKSVQKQFVDVLSIYQLFNNRKYFS